MNFILNVNLNVKNGKQHRLSDESLAVLALVNYCELIKNKDFECICYFDSNLISSDEDANKLIHELDNVYSNLNNRHFFVYYSDKNCDKAENRILLRPLSDLNDHYARDTNFPSLIRQTNGKWHYVVTGLASVYRDIVKIAHMLSSDLKLDALLVRLKSIKKHSYYRNKKKNVKKGLSTKEP
jgi:hypothetical protein